MPTGSERFVVLAGGLTVPAESIRLLLRLEAAGLQVTREGNELLVRPRGQLTPDDRAALARWRAHVLALIDYAPSEVH
jgi:hypothetical protein